MKIILSLALLLLSSCSIFAQSSTEIWDGTLDVTIAKLRLKLEMTLDENNAWQGKMFSVDQGNSEMKLDQLQRSDDSLSFEVKRLRVKFEGKINADAGTIRGTFTQDGRSSPLEFVKGEESKPTTHIQTWNGTLQAGGRKFDFQFRVMQDEDEKLSAKLDSFSERIFGLNCDVKHEENGTITVKIPVTGATYIGTISDDMQTIDGKWKQAGGEFDLQLTRVPLDRTRNSERPQTPRAPFPYNEKEVSFENKNANIKLAGTLTSPRSGKSPAVILITGSGPQDRDETIMDHKPFAVIADHLSRKGIAVLRYDERGVGESSGDFSTATSADLATDVEAAIDFLKSQPEIDAAKILLAGHSEGGLLAPMIASRRDDLAGIVLLAPPGVNGAKLVMNQSRMIAKVAAAADDEALDKQEQILKIAFDLIKSPTPDSGDFYEAFKVKAAEIMGQDHKDFQLQPEIEISVRQLDTPWFRYLANYEPVPALEKTKCPVLVLIGEKDLQVNPKLNLPPIEAALTKGGNQDFTVTPLKGLNHLFQECETGSPGEYGSIDQTFSPKALNLIEQWINKRYAK